MDPPPSTPPGVAVTDFLHVSGSRSIRGDRFGLAWLPKTPGNFGLEALAERQE